MAALKFISVRNFSTNCLRFAVPKNHAGGRCLVEQLTTTDDGKTFVAWHSKPDFPYEYSRPLPSPEQTNTSSLIKESAMKNAMSAFRNKHPEVARQELMNLTHTCKHRWFPRARDKRAKKTPMDRKYL